MKNMLVLAYTRKTFPVILNIINIITVVYVWVWANINDLKTLHYIMSDSTKIKTVCSEKRLNIGII